MNACMYDSLMMDGPYPVCILCRQARDAAAILEEAALLLPLHTGVYYAPPYITAMVQVHSHT